MRKVLFVLVMFALLCLAPIPKPGQQGTYNTASRLAFCKTHDTCLHEIAHALDQQAGWVSQSPEFKIALQMYLFLELRNPVLQQAPADILELTYYSSDHQMRYIKMELYAYFFEHAKGNAENMPEVFRAFYDWDAASQLIARLQDDQKLYWLN